MAACLACLGEGHQDHRNDDAWWSEHYSDAQLESMRERGLNHPLGIVTCEECEGTGVITQERYDDLYAAAVSAIDQAKAAVEARAREEDA